MPIFTFSTKTKKPQDTTEVEELKDYCDKRGLNFSAFMIKLIKENNDARRSQI
jgi:hypothetical protein